MAALEYHAFATPGMCLAEGCLQDHTGWSGVLVVKAWHATIWVDAGHIWSAIPLGRERILVVFVKPGQVGWSSPRVAQGATRSCSQWQLPSVVVQNADSLGRINLNLPRKGLGRLAQPAQVTPHG